MAMTVGEQLRQEGESRQERLAEGERKGRRALLLMVLDRGVSLTPAQRQELETCEDEVFAE